MEAEIKPGAVAMTTAMIENRAELLAEDIECLHMNLDDEGVPRENSGNAYSLWGRVQLYKAMQPKGLTSAEWDHILAARKTKESMEFRLRMMQSREGDTFNPFFAP